MNVPNILTIFRIILVPFFIYSFIFVNKWIALGVFLLAGITDAIDGYIARKFNLITDLGKVLDPLADKLLLLAVIFLLAFNNYIPYFAMWIIFTKEIIMILGGVYFYFRKEKLIIPSNKYGKISTILFYIAIFGIILNINYTLNSVLIILAVIFTIITFLQYMKIAFKLKN